MKEKMAIFIQSALFGVLLAYAILCVINYLFIPISSLVFLACFLLAFVFSLILAPHKASTKKRNFIGGINISFALIMLACVFALTTDLGSIGHLVSILFGLATFFILESLDKPQGKKKIAAFTTKQIYVVATLVFIICAVLALYGFNKWAVLCVGIVGFFLPGMLWSHACFFDKELPLSERVLFGCMFSAGLVPLILFVLSLLLNEVTILLLSSIIVALLVSAGFILFRRHP